MKALYWDGTALAVVDREPPKPPDGCAVVRVQVAGVCNTDLEIVRGYMGFRGVLGHEIVGVVVDGPREWLNLRVVAEINYACGQCESCRAGLGRHCPTRRVMGILDADGGFAELVAVPVANLHRVGERVSDRRAVFAEPLAAAYEILEQIEVHPSSRCTVLGDGKLGLLVAQVLAETGAEVTAVGKHPDKLSILRARGIEAVELGDWQPNGADVVVEATGSAEGFARAVAATRPRGTLVLKSTVAECPNLDLAPIVINEISVIGSRCGPFEPALRALATGSIETDALISETMPLARGVEALERAGKSGTLKVLLEIG